MTSCGAESWKRLDAWFARAPRAREAIAYAAPVAGYSLLQIFLYFDRTIYRLYDYHLNGFVWNLLTTRGGVEALGSLEAGGCSGFVGGAVAQPANMKRPAHKWRAIQILSRWFIYPPSKPIWTTGP